MQVQRVQSNHNQTFGAKVTILDGDKIIPKGIKRTFTKMCRDLGCNTDKIGLSVQKGNNKIGELETDVFLLTINEGYLGHAYGLDANMQPIVTGYRFHTNEIYREELPVWTSREYSMPRNLAKLYKDYILPVFKDNIIDIKNFGDTAETKLLSAAKLKN